MEKIVSLCKRRGFVYPSSEIYGGLGAIYDYGPYGVELKRNIRSLWWHHMVDLRKDVVGLESSVIMNSKVWAASGHLKNFTDPVSECQGKCKRRWRSDHVVSGSCPQCGGELSSPKSFGTMFKTHFGPSSDTASEVYLRPETAQGMFVDFANIVDSMRVRVPFGVAQIGKSFRNEISPSDFLFRTREFEQGEMEFFVEPGKDEEWFEYWQKERMAWYTKILGIKPGNLRMRDHRSDERAHYAKASSDIEYLFPFGWGEIEGIANRGDFDLKSHETASGKNLRYADPYTGYKFMPYVIEPAVGIDRVFVAALCDAYLEEPLPDGSSRVVLALAPALAPVQVAVLVHEKKADMKYLATHLADALRNHFRVEYDETGSSIGSRYRRQDEIGTPFCLTVDAVSVQDKSVTIRERDSRSQERVPVTHLLAYLNNKLGINKDVLELGL